ncbi:hypothetical protein [Anaplasma marginale]|uniref:hypothetical protein n=1 Tax=Anaplasma marginale TaxID=770 RepID=UPI001F073754|nr:hypothetical protein [Anaplasma marginale]
MELTLKFKVREGVELQPLEQVFSECADRCVALINRLNTEHSKWQPAPSTALTGFAAEVATPSTALGV